MPPEFLGLNRNGGFQQLTNIGRSTYHSLQTKVRANVGRTLTTNVAYTFSRSMDTLSSDGGLVEHDPTRPENNFGPSDYDRTHRLTTSFTLDARRREHGSFTRALTGGWNMSGIFTYQSGTPFSVIGNPTRNAFFAQVARPRVSFAPGMTWTMRSGPGGPRIGSTTTSTSRLRRLARSVGQHRSQHPARPVAGAGRPDARALVPALHRAPRGAAVGDLQRAEHARVRQPGVHVRRQRRRHRRPHHLHHRRPADDAARGPLPVLRRT